MALEFPRLSRETARAMFVVVAVGRHERRSSAASCWRADWLVSPSLSVPPVAVHRVGVGRAGKAAIGPDCACWREEVENGLSESWHTSLHKARKTNKKRKGRKIERQEGNRERNRQSNTPAIFVLLLPRHSFLFPPSSLTPAPSLPASARPLLLRVLAKRPPSFLCRLAGPRRTPKRRCNGDSLCVTALEKVALCAVKHAVLPVACCLSALFFSQPRPPNERLEAPSTSLHRFSQASNFRFGAVRPISGTSH